ncbi:MAG: hypothetical protein JWO09_3122 [Bacteroidetes bacterium]|nr:hypothetical protein [Bacteroidota bacterium]
MTRILIIIFTFINIYSFGQTDPLNQLDEKKEKDGYWVQYLDSLLYPIDSANAYFYGYDLYDHGLQVFKFSNRPKSWKKDKMIFEGRLPEKGKPSPVEGTFKFYWPEMRLESEEIYKGGKPLYMKSFVYNRRDQVNAAFNEVLYFDKLYNNIPGTFYYEEYWHGKLSKKYWFRKGRKKWESIRIRE